MMINQPNKDRTKKPPSIMPNYTTKHYLVQGFKGEFEEELDKMVRNGWEIDGNVGVNSNTKIYYVLMTKQVLIDKEGNEVNLNK